MTPQIIPRVTPFLWFDREAEEAMELYVSLFEDSRILELTRYGEGGPAPAGTVMSGRFVLSGQEFMALNGGPEYRFTEAFSLFVSCDGQPEVDRLWDALTADGGAPGRCGWLKDRFGLSWQIIPTALPAMLADPDPDKSGRAMQAMLQMDKIDISALRGAYEGTQA